MNNKDYFVIVLILILFIYFMYYAIYSETFNLLEDCNFLSKKVFMIRDLRTKLWLSSGDDNILFMPGQNGITFTLSDNYNDYLPLKLSSYIDKYLIIKNRCNNINDLTIITNPDKNLNIIQVFIYKNYNILGFIDNYNKIKYLFINDDGSIEITTNPDNSSIIEIIEL